MGLVESTLGEGEAELSPTEQRQPSSLPVSPTHTTDANQSVISHHSHTLDLHYMGSRLGRGQGKRVISMGYVGF
jgi:hypothetical protein